MVSRDFLADLRGTCDLFSWEVQQNRRILGSLKTGETLVAFDPITALAFLKSGCAFAQGDWLRAGRMLGLSENDSDAIIDATGNKLWKYVDDDLALDGYAEWLRPRLSALSGWANLMLGCGAYWTTATKTPIEWYAVGTLPAGCPGGRRRNNHCRRPANRKVHQWDRTAPSWQSPVKP